jgi:hypothetical protein
MQLELCWVVRGGSHAEIYLGNWRLYLWHLSIYKFIVNSEIHGINTRQYYNLHQPLSNLTKYQKGICYSELKVYNNLHPHITDTSDDLKKFEAQLKQFLHLHSFYSLQEYFHYKSFSRH